MRITKNAGRAKTSERKIKQTQMRSIIDAQFMKTMKIIPLIKRRIAKKRTAEGKRSNRPYIQKKIAANKSIIPSNFTEIMLRQPRRFS